MNGADTGYGSPWPRRVLLIYMIILLAFMFLPILAMIIFSFNDSAIPSLPWGGFTFDWYGEFLHDPDLIQGLKNSLMVATFVSVVSTSIALATAYFLRRSTWKYKEIVTASITAPALLPALMGGLAIFTMFNIFGWVGSRLALACALCTLGIPYGLAVIRSQLAEIDPLSDEAAINLGAGHYKVLRTIIVPQAWPGILGSLLLTFVVGWDEFIISWFVTNFETTLPVRVFEQMGSSFSPKINAVGTIVFLISLTMTLGVYFLVLRPAFIREEERNQA